MSSEDSGSYRSARRDPANGSFGSAGKVRIAGLVVAATGVSGLLASGFLERAGLAEAVPEISSNVFHRLYVLFEGPFLWLLVLFGILAIAWSFAQRGARSSEQDRFSVSRRTLRWLVALLAAGVLVTSLLGVRGVMHGLPLSADEFASTFQARIFARGQLETRLPSGWEHFGWALTPMWVDYKRATHAWTSIYLPVDSAVRAAFLRLGAETATNAVVGCLTLLVLAAVGRRIWPNENGLALLAVVLLAASSQFVVTSMSAYAMPLELFFNLLWLLLYLRDDPASRIALPCVGVVALGVHHPFAHALFAAPFLLRLLRKRRDAWLAYTAVVYALGIAAWWSYLRSVQPFMRGGAFWSLFSIPLLPDLLLQLMHLTLVLSWQSPLVPVLLVVGLLSFRGLSEPLRDLATGLGLTFLFYALFPYGQGHGWGYRYVYAVLGNVVILAVYGLKEAAASLRFEAVPLAASLAVAVGWQIPRRLSDVESFVAPFARAHAYVSSFQGALVLIDPRIGWYAQDLVRNDPFLENDPKVLFANRLVPAWRDELEANFPGRARVLGWEELARLGYPGASPPGAPLRMRPPAMTPDAVLPGRVRWAGADAPQ